MNGIFKDSLKLFGRGVVVTILSIIVVISMVAISVAVSAKPVGYTVFGTKDGETTQLYTHYNADGEDLKLASYEAEGYKIDKKELKEVPKGEGNIYLWIAQLFTLGIMASFIYPVFWSQGYKHRNMVMTGHMVEDKLRGLKVGLIATIPAFLSVPVFAVLKNAPVALFKIINGVFFPIIGFLAGDVTVFSKLAIWKMLIILILFLSFSAASALGYYLGYKDFSIGEKFIYKKTKKRR